MNPEEALFLVIIGGIIMLAGMYWLQKYVDKECVENYQKHGYGVVGKEE